MLHLPSVLHTLLSQAATGAPAAGGGVGTGVGAGIAGGSQTWTLGVVALIGLALMTIAVFRNGRRIVQSGEDAPTSIPQQRWAAGDGLSATARAAKPTAKDRTLTAAAPSHKLTPAADPLLAAAAADLVALLDQRAERLERLIHQADARLAQLRRLSDAPPSGRAPGTADFGRELKPSSDAPAPSSRTSNVYRLVDEGLTPAEISETTGIAIGEINLVLALRK